MHRSMLLALASAAWLGGVAASAMLGGGAWPLLLAAAAIAAVLALRDGDHRLWLYAGLLPALIAGGIAMESRARDAADASSIAQYRDGVAMRFRGEVREDPARRDTTQRFVVDVSGVQESGGWRDVDGAAAVTAPLLPALGAGDVIVIEGAFEAPERVEGFDYDRYLALHGIDGVFGFPQLTVVGHDPPPWWRAAILGMRRDLARGLRLALPEPQSSLAEGVLLGNRAALPNDVEADLNASSTSHLVVVSGANVVLVSAFCGFVCSLVTGRRRALLLSIVAIAAYGLLVGASPPVVRAMIMGVLLVVARAAGRRSDGATAILSAAAIMAALDPLVIRDVSFQLSFAATAGIMLLAGPLQRAFIAAAGRVLRRDQVPRVVGPLVAEPLAVTIAAMIATAPLLAFYFGRVSVVAIPANVLIVPAFPFILLASLLAAVGGLFPFGHIALGAPAYLLLSYWLKVASVLSSLPGASLDVGEASWAALAAYAAIAVALWWLLPRLRRIEGAALAPSRPGGWRPLRAAALAGVPMVALAGSAFVLMPSGPSRLEVTVLDVGQGDAILIETPSGRNVLVDGGPGPAVVRGLSDALSWRDRRIDLVVLTHPQADHATGLIDVFARYDVRRVAGGLASGDAGIVERAFMAAAVREGRDIEYVRAGTTFDLGGGVLLEVLAPTGATASDASPNNRAVVLRLVYGDVSFLLTGDIEADAESALIASGADLSATVLKVPHHGSATSSTQAFLDAVQPSVSVVSAGRDNRYGHPRAEVVARLDAYGPVLTTATSGAIHFESDGRRLWIDD